MARDIKTLSIVAERFATIRIPRILTNSTHYFQNIHGSKSIQPITVIKTSKLNLRNSLLYNLGTGEVLKDWKEQKDTWFIIDGQERLKAMMLYYTTTGDNSFMTIDAIVEDLDNIPDENIVKYLTDWHFMADEWSSKEYVEKCLMLHPSYKVFRMTQMLMRLKASISTVSRYAAGKPSILNKKNLVSYINGDETVMSDVCCERALELYRLFLEVGFSQAFINQRYLIDYVNSQINILGWQAVIDRIATANLNIVKLIEAMTPEDYATGQIQKTLDRHYAICKKAKTNKTYIVDFSRERFEENMKDIPRLLNQ